MNPSLHPDLVRLQLEYDQVLDAFEQGSLSLQEARATISALSVIDADGALWGLDEDGNFVRRRNPTTPPEMCNPTLFAAARAPAPHPGPTTPQPQPQPQQQPQPQPSVGADPRVAASPGNVPYPSAYPQSTPGGDAFDNIPEPVDRGSRRSGRTTQRNAPAVFALAGDWLREHMATAAVVGVIAIMLVIAVLTRGGDTEPGDTLPTGSLTPGSTEQVVTAPVVTEQPTTTEAATTTEATTTTLAPTTTLPPLPETARVTEVFEALASGSREAVIATVDDPVDVPTSARAIAFHAGVGPAGMVINVGDLVEDGAGRAQQRWELTDVETGEVLATSTVVWVREADSVWKMATWAAFAVGG